MTPHTITYPIAIKYADDGSTVTLDLLALASLIPSEKGNSFYFPITIPRNIVPQPEFESDDELRKINKALTDLSFDLDRVWNAVKNCKDLVRQVALLLAIAIMHRQMRAKGSSKLYLLLLL